MPWDLLIRPKRGILQYSMQLYCAVLAPRHDVWRASFAAGAAMPGAQPRGGQLKANNAFGGIASTRSYRYRVGRWAALHTSSALNAPLPSVSNASKASLMEYSASLHALTL